jgi:citrate lyase subunit beta / citryl-CoA lyase
MPPSGFHEKAKRNMMRSLLFVPGDSPRKLEKAFGAGADALIIDWEDSVVPAGKAAAREIIAEVITSATQSIKRPTIFIRVNPLSGADTQIDLTAAIRHGVDGIVLPKTVGGRDIRVLDAKITQLEIDRNISAGQTKIIAIATENAAGVLALGSIAGSSTRLSGIAWGGEDLAADIGAETNRRADGGYSETFRLVRSLTLLAAASAQTVAIDAVYTSFRDLAGLKQECEEARRDGFTAKMAIHPDQVAVINATFTPSAKSIAWADRVIKAFAADTTVGVVVIDGEMIDQPHLKRARRILGLG